MRSTKTLAGALALLVVLAGSAFAADKASEVTVTGAMQCAKCTLKAAGATECQDVVVVAGMNGAPDTDYYLVKNDVEKKFGHVCTGTKKVALTGTVKEKDGKKWLTPTKISEAKG
jgi:hypothetical protein